MVERFRPADVIADEVDQAREEEARLRWINAHVREASEADLIEEIDILEDDEEQSTRSE